MLRGGARAVSLARPPDAPSIERSAARTASRWARSTAPSATGCTSSGNPLALPMTLRRDGRRSRAHAEPGWPTRSRTRRRASRCSSTACARPTTPGSSAPPATSPTARGCRPSSATRRLYLRYNTGRHVSENGRDWRTLLDAARARWPVEVHEIALIGHSMGGLVARSACHYAVERLRGREGRATCSRSARRTAARRSRRPPRPPTAALARLPETRGFAQALQRPQLRDQGPRPRLPRRRGLARPGPRRVRPAGRLARSRSSTAPTTTSSARDACPASRTRRSGGSSATCWSCVPSAWAHAAPRRAAALPGRALPPRRRRQPLRSAQPPGDLRADPPVAGRPPGDCSAGRASTLAYAFGRS